MVTRETSSHEKGYSGRESGGSHNTDLSKEGHTTLTFLIG